MSNGTLEIGITADGEFVTKPEAKAPKAKTFSKMSGSYMAPETFVKLVGQVDGQNIRIDYGDIAQFAETILAAGRVVSPTEIRKVTDDDRKVMGDDFPFTYVVNGNGSRCHAAVSKIVLELKKGDQLARIPVQMAKDTSQKTRLQRMLTARQDESQKPLTIIEQADGMRRLRDDCNLTDRHIAELIGVSIQKVQNCLGLLEADKSVQKAAMDPNVGLRIAYGIAKKHVGDPECQRELVKEAKAPPEGKRKVKRSLGYQSSAVDEKNEAEDTVVEVLGDLEEAEKRAAKASKKVTKVNKAIVALVAEQLQNIERLLAAVQCGDLKTSSKALKKLSIDVVRDELMDFVAHSPECQVQVAYAWGKVHGALEIGGLNARGLRQVAEG